MTSFFRLNRNKKGREIDALIRHLRKIADRIEPIDNMMGELDEALRDLIKVAKIIGADEKFVQLDGLKVLIGDESDDESDDDGMPYQALLKSLIKFKEDDPLMFPCEVYSRIYGVILELEEYKKFIN